MQLRSIVPIAILILLAFQSPSVMASPGSFLQEVQEVTLDNGMKFLLLRREGAPVFTAYIRVKVGGLDESAGKTGIAHLLEHMAFKGTPEIGTRDYDKEKVILAKIEELQLQKQKSGGKNREDLSKQISQLIDEAGKFVVKEEFSKIYQRNGASGLNATTSQDLTSYFVTLPSNKLKLWAYLESNRLRNPVFREFYSERDVVREERRTRVDDSPFGKLYEAFISLSFEKSPYHRPTIGYKTDIKKLTATQLEEFYRKYYVPSNMVGAIVGDIDPVQTKKILEEYFGEIPKEPAPEKLKVIEPEPKSPKRTVVPFAASPSLMFGYLKPTMPHPDDYVFDVLEQILCEGRTSRLYKKLVVDERLVQQISCSPAVPGSRLENLFFVFASIQNGKRAEAVLRAFDNIIKDIEFHGVNEAEMKKAKKNIKSTWYYELESNSDIARALSFFEIVGGDWKYILSHSNKIDQITSEEVKRVVKKYLQPKRRRVAILKPI